MEKPTEPPPPQRMTLSAIADLPDAEYGRTWCCVGPSCWGRAISARRAIKPARLAGGGRGYYVLHLVNADAMVNQTGTLQYDKDAPGIRLNVAVWRRH